MYVHASTYFSVHIETTKVIVKLTIIMDSSNSDVAT